MSAPFRPRAAHGRTAFVRAAFKPGVLALALATAAGAGIQNILFGVSARDPMTYATVVGLIAVVSLAATLVPARRATRVDPMIALRAE